MGSTLEYMYFALYLYNVWNNDHYWKGSRQPKMSYVVHIAIIIYHMETCYNDAIVSELEGI